MTPALGKFLLKGRFLQFLIKGLVPYSKNELAPTLVPLKKKLVPIFVVFFNPVIPTGFRIIS